MARRRPAKPRKPANSRDSFQHQPFGALTRLRGAVPPRDPVQHGTPPRSVGAESGAATSRDAETTRRRSADSSSHSAAVATQPDDDDVFRAAMVDVRPLAREARIDAPSPALAFRRAPVSEEDEALAALSDLISGAASFDVSDSTEYLEGAVVGLDPRILRRLRSGEFAYQAYLDLHGLTVVEARAALETFVSRAVLDRHRCVLIVHGRGLNSKDNVPVLKERVKTWLAHGRIGRAVLAFTSARPADGGTGAVYVLLRRRRGEKEPIAVYEGAKRE